MRRVTSVLALLLLVLPLRADALGLGDIKLLSALNEPLDARISLRAVKEGDIDDITVRIASKDHFQNAGIVRALVLTSLQFSSTESAIPGTGEIRITTREPVTEPFLNFLLDVDWRQGRVIREYTVLLDPPIYGAAISTAVEEAVTTIGALPVDDEPQQPDNSTPNLPATDVSLSSGGATSTQIGPVTSTDTLWSLAARLRPDNSATVQQTMLALLKINPNAFADGNINALQEGAILKVPDLSEIKSINAADALIEVKRQHALWEEYRLSASASITQQPQGDANAGTATTSGFEESVDLSASESSSADDSSRLDIVSAGSSESGVGGNAEDVVALHNELSMALEDADNERRANDEMRARLEEADAIISKLQRAVSIKDDDIAALQDELAKTQAESQTPKVTNVTVESELEVPPEPAPEFLPQPTSVSDFVASFFPLNNPLILGVSGGGLLILVILIVVFARRRRQPDLEETGVSAAGVAALNGSDQADIPTIAGAEQPSSEEDSEVMLLDADDVTELPSAVEETQIPPQGMSAKVAPQDDPLEGLNIYLAYEDYENATKLVKGVIAQHPDRYEYQLRLLEIFHSTKNVSAFEAIAGELQSKVGDDSPMMESARRWWGDLAVGRALFDKAAAIEAGENLNETIVGTDNSDAIFDVTNAGDDLFGANGTLEISLDDVESEAERGGVDFDLGFEFESDEGQDADASGTSQSHTLDFELTAESAGSDGEGSEVVGLDFDLGMDSDPSDVTVTNEEGGSNTLDFERDVAGDADPDRPSASPDDMAMDIALATEDAQDGGEHLGSEDGLDFAVRVDDLTQVAPDSGLLGEESSIADGIDFDLDFDTSGKIESDASDELFLDDAMLDDEMSAALNDEITDTSSSNAEEEVSFTLDTDVESQAESWSEDFDDEPDISIALEDVDGSTDLAISLPEQGRSGFKQPDSTGSSADDLDASFNLDAVDESVELSDQRSEGPDASLELALALDELDPEIDAGAVGGDSDVDFALDDHTMDDSTSGNVLASPESGEELDFALDIAQDDESDEDIGISLGTTTDTPVDFGLDWEAQEDSEQLSEQGATDDFVADEDLDFTLDFDDKASELLATPDSSSSGQAPDDDRFEDDDLDFALDLDENQGDDDLSLFDLALDEPDEQPTIEAAQEGESTQYMLRDVPQTVVEAAPSESGAKEVAEVTVDDASDTVFTIDEPGAKGDADDTIDLTLIGEDDGEDSASGFESGIEAMDVVIDPDEATDTPQREYTSLTVNDMASTDALDEVMDISLDLSDLSDELDLTLDIDDETTPDLVEGVNTDMPTLDFTLEEDPSTTDGGSHFETVQLRAEDLVRVGAIDPEILKTLDEVVGELEVDSDFADIFADPFEEGSEENFDGVMELPDSALAAEEADVANVDEVDFELGIEDDSELVSDDSDSQRTQYMLRDIANITSVDEGDNEDDNSFVLDRGVTGEVDKMQTKLDLAQAYVDMGDIDGARNILGEVIADGSPAQQDLAQQLLSQLN